MKTTEISPPATGSMTPAQSHNSQKSFVPTYDVFYLDLYSMSNSMWIPVHMFNDRNLSCMCLMNILFQCWSHLYFTFYLILEYGYGHLCLFNDKSKWEVTQSAQSVFQFILEVFSEVDVRILFRPLNFFQTKLAKPCLHGDQIVQKAVMLEHVC